jgi:hypothetical protein
MIPMMRPVIYDVCIVLDLATDSILDIEYPKKGRLNQIVMLI